MNGLPVREAEMSLDDVKLQLHDCHLGPLSCVASVLDRDSGRGARPGLAGHAWAQAADGGRVETPRLPHALTVSPAP